MTLRERNTERLPPWLLWKMMEMPPVAKRFSLFVAKPPDYSLSYPEGPRCRTQTQMQTVPRGVPSSLQYLVDEGTNY